ncbi:MAG TPA: hypothetical protein VHC22_02975 [Pirellulales bacterium]|nr:hypothetical protein [Pirellulales bacterium]
MESLAKPAEAASHTAIAAVLPIFMDARSVIRFMKVEGLRFELRPQIASPMRTFLQRRRTSIGTLVDAIRHVFAFFRWRSCSNEIVITSPDPSRQHVTDGCSIATTAVINVVAIRNARRVNRRRRIVIS